LFGAAERRNICREKYKLPKQAPTGRHVCGGHVCGWHVCRGYFCEWLIYILHYLQIVRFRIYSYLYNMIVGLRKPSAVHSS
jgi:hypothetical protein